MKPWKVFLTWAAALLQLGLLQGAESPPPPKLLSLLIMDPLAKENGCACVAGMGQRDYEALGRHLSKALKIQVDVRFALNFSQAVGAGLRRGPDIVIGKDSQVEADLRSWNWPMTRMARLTDLQGRTTLTGLFVVPATDTARNLRDLNERPFLLGKPDETEKHGAAMAALRAAGVEPGHVLKVLPDCTATANELLSHQDTPAPAGVISSYALPLLEGCGNIPPKSLRVVGRTAPVPFITVFVYRDLDKALVEGIRKALMEVAQNRTLCRLLESRDGFVPFEDPQQALKDWPGWGGAMRWGQTSRLPNRLPQPLPVSWERPLNHPGLGGVAAAKGYVVVSDRDPLDKADLWRCYEAASGKLLWTLQQPTRGPHMDYGNSPRSTPLIVQGRVFMLGAYGDLLAADLATGKILWKRHLVKDFKGRLPKWGFANSPLFFENRLWVLPGGEKHFIAALDPATGKTICTGPGTAPPAYAALMAGEWDGQSMVIAYDENGLGGWSAQTAKPLWRVTAAEEGDFNVPTPMFMADGLLLATENNGCRLHRFDGRGALLPEPVAAHKELRPQTATPLVIGNFVLCNGSGLICLKFDFRKQQLLELWKKEDDAWAEHVSCMTDGTLALILGYHGDLLLLDVTSEDYKELSRLRLFEDEQEIYAHPALADGKYFVRGANVLRCYELIR